MFFSNFAQFIIHSYYFDKHYTYSMYVCPSSF